MTTENLFVFPSMILYCEATFGVMNPVNLVLYRPAMVA